MNRISVIVPAYNIADYITPCLTSVIAQSLTNWECIVVDDGSTDNTTARVAAFTDPRITLVRQPNGGVSSARNLGLERARGAAVMFLDGDDLLHPSALARLDAALQTRPDAVAAYGTFTKVLPDGTPYPGQKPLSQHRYPDGDVLEAMLRENFLANGGHVLVRVEAARRLGGFDTRLRLSEDWEFWCRLAAVGPFAFIGNEPEVFTLRVRPGSASGGLSVDWNQHRPSIDAVTGNPAIRQRFDERQWRRIVRGMTASAMWESGRVNFTMRHFAAAWRLMTGAVRLEPTPKRITLLAAAIAQRWTNRQFVSRLRYRDADIAAAARPD